VPAKRAKRSSIRKRIGRGVLLFATLLAAYAAYIYVTLPDVTGLAKVNPKTTAFMQLRIEEARDDRRKFSVRQQWIPYRQISPLLRRAVIVTEDAAFFDHDGIDLDEIKASLERNWEEGQFLRGGSTITQQLAKNLFLSPSKNPVRKLRELLIARRLEAELSKQRILELYLNVVEWGDGIYGAEAAARVYFGKPAGSLSTAESALLAAALSNARLLNPAHPTPRLRRRQAMVMRRMGAVTPPPVVAGPVLPPPPAAPADNPGTEIPAPHDAPAVLPGEPVAVPKGPGAKAPELQKSP
jgi:monofunctional biosynthetic peptidoglycan transglycosylase